MTCFKPLKCYKSREPDGSQKILFTRPPGDPQLFQVPCGQCIGCRLARSREWAVRCIHEASQHTANSFITLTYDDFSIPDDYSLNKQHFTNFLKRLRYYTKTPLRFYMCGEYGDLTGRPHYYAIIFGYDFPDREKHGPPIRGHQIYTSEELSKAWQNQGFVTVGDVTFQSAAYVARYIMKKVTGPQADDHYWFTHPVSLKTFRQEPEYNNMSRDGGIGRGWLDEYSSELYPDDFALYPTGSGAYKKASVPRYYDKIMDEMDPGFMDDIRDARLDRAAKHADNCTPARLSIRERVQTLKLEQLKRTAQ